MTFPRYLAALPFLALAACVPKPAQTPAPAPTPTPTPIAVPAPTPAAPPFAGSWMDAPLTPGDWTYRVGPGDTTIALFGEIPDRPLLSIGCYEAGQVVTLTRYERAAPAPFTILSEAHNGTLVTRASTPEGFLLADVAASEPLLDAMAFSKGRFAIETPGLATLYVPSYPEITRVIEDCR